MKKDVINRKIGKFAIISQIPIEKISNSDVPWNSFLSQDQMLLPYLDSNKNVLSRNSSSIDPPVQAKKIIY